MAPSNVELPLAHRRSEAELRDAIGPTVSEPRDAIGPTVCRDFRILIRYAFVCRPARAGTPREKGKHNN